MLACRRLDSTGAVVDLDADEWHRRWDALRATYPQSFRQSPPAAAPTDVLPEYRAALAAWAKAPPPAAEEADKAEADKADAGRPPSAAERLGSLSWTELRCGLFREAQAAAELSQQLDPALVWPRANLAHARLMAGDVEQAKAIYRQNKDARFELNGGPTTFADTVRADFDELRRAGMGRPEMADVEALLAGPATRPAE
jgi:hypothetical protein